MARSWIRKLAGDRFVWFLILGAGLFALHAWLDNPASNIRVSSSDMTMLASRWQAQTGAEDQEPDEPVARKFSYPGRRHTLTRNSDHQAGVYQIGEVHARS